VSTGNSIFQKVLIFGQRGGGGGVWKFKNISHFSHRKSSIYHIQVSLNTFVTSKGKKGLSINSLNQGEGYRVCPLPLKFLSDLFKKITKIHINKF